jgi:hypothetical protein
MMNRIVKRFKQVRYIFKAQLCKCSEEINVFKTKFLYSRDWRPEDLAKVTPEQRKSYERRLLRCIRFRDPQKKKFRFISQNPQHILNSCASLCPQSRAPDFKVYARVINLFAIIR